ncbi:ubiquinone biosynthesis O-methyltransferase [bacterium BMS3Bbin03]|nr:ubiquinone biosynthesis O-methyltransferase [bacterium BMS3Bbin03]
MRIDEARLKNFYEEVGAKYPEEEVVYHTLKGRLRKKFVLNFVRGARGRFLDVGCNTGVYLRHYENGNAIGIDLAHSVLKKARERLPRNSANKFYFLVGSAEDLSFLSENSINSYLCSEVLEHVFHSQKVFNGIARVLRPGGRALVTTPNYRKNRPQWVEIGVLKKYEIEGDEYFHSAYRPEEMAGMAQKAGLRVLEQGTLEWEIKYTTKLPVLILWSIRWLNRRTFKSSALESWNQALFERLSGFIYLLGHFTQLEKIFHFFIKEGVRSYVILTK